MARLRGHGWLAAAGLLLAVLSRADTDLEVGDDAYVGKGPNARRSTITKTAKSTANQGDSVPYTRSNDPSIF